MQPTNIVVEKSVSEVFNAINNVSAWWHGEIVGTANKLDDEFAYRMKDIHYSNQKVIELVPNKKIVWLVTDSQLNFTNNKNSSHIFKLKQKKRYNCSNGFSVQL